MVMQRREWTTKELAYVREHYPMQGGKKVGAALGRSAGSVNEFARRHGIKCLNQVGTYTLATAKARCVIDPCDEDSCWSWTGRLSSGIPYAWHNGSLVSMRKVVYELHFGRPVRDGYAVRMSCECGECLNPRHMKEQARGKLLRENAAKEPLIRKRARLAAAAIARGEAVLDMERAREIRASAEPSKVLAERYGVTVTTINRIRRGQSWRDFSAAGAGRLAA